MSSLSSACKVSHAILADPRHAVADHIEMGNANIWSCTGALHQQGALCQLLAPLPLGARPVMSHLCLHIFPCQLHVALKLYTQHDGQFSSACPSMRTPCMQPTHAGARAQHAHADMQGIAFCALRRAGVGVSYGRGNGFVVAKKRPQKPENPNEGSRRGRRHHISKVQEASAEQRVAWTAPSYFNVVVGGGTSGIEWSALAAHHDGACMRIALAASKWPTLMHVP